MRVWLRYESLLFHFIPIGYRDLSFSLFPWNGWGYIQPSSQCLRLLKSAMNNSSILLLNKKQFCWILLVPVLYHSVIQDSSVNNATGCWLDWFNFGLVRDMSLRHFQTHSGAHSTFYPVATGGCFLGDKVVSACSWPFASISCQGVECVELNLISSMCIHSAVLMYRRGQKFSLSRWWYLLHDAGYYLKS
jgi:hypothetical protein